MGTDAVAELWPLFLILAVLLALAGIVLYANAIGQGTVRRPEAVAQPEDAVAPPVPRHIRRRQARQRRVAAPPPHVGLVVEDVEGVEEGFPDDTYANEPGSSSRPRRIGVKKAARMAAKREAREARAAALAEFREQQAIDDELREQWRLEEAEEEERAAHAAAVAQKEREEREQTEFEQWRGLISVEEAGSAAEALAKEAPDMLTQFCEYVRKEKVVPIENIAAEFDLPSEAVIDRLRRLEESGVLSGFFDDRGKFIYVSNDEMRAVAQFINDRGRVSIEELAGASTRLLGLK